MKSTTMISALSVVACIAVVSHRLLNVRLSANQIESVGNPNKEIQQHYARPDYTAIFTSEYERIAFEAAKAHMPILEDITPTTRSELNMVVVSFQIRRQPRADERPPPSGTPFKCLVYIDTNTMAVVDVIEW